MQVDTEHQTVDLTEGTIAMSIDYPFPVVLVAAPGVLGELGAQILAIAAKCRECGGEGIVNPALSPVTLADPAEVGWDECGACEGRGVAVYLDYGATRDAYRASYAEAIERLTEEQRAAAVELTKRLQAESQESFRRAVGREMAGKLVQTSDEKLTVVKCRCSNCGMIFNCDLNKYVESFEEQAVLCSSCERQLSKGRPSTVQPGELEDAGRGGLDRMRR